MSKCSKCPYTTEVTRTFGVTKHCGLEPTQMGKNHKLDE